MGSSGGGSTREPNYATPSGTTGYGSSSAFNPTWNSVLNGGGWATNADVDAASASNAQAQQQAAAQQAASSGMSDQQLRSVLASMMQQQPPRTVESETMARRSTGGYGGYGAPWTGGGMPARR